MTVYYADFDLGTGDNTGASWTHAWKTFADVIAGTGSAAPAAGDTIYCRGTESSACTNTLSGDETTGLIKWIGCNASGNNDGTRTVINIAGAGVPLTQTGAYNLYENFRFTGSSDNDGVEGTGDYNVYINCSFDGNSLYGYYGSGMNTCVLIRCTAYNNASGFYGGINDRYFFCSAHDNSADGFVPLGNYPLLVGCLAYDNGDKGCETLGLGGTAFNCVFDNNADDGILIRSVTGGFIYVVIGCRITNQSGAGDIGLNANGEICLYGWNYISNNADTIYPGAGTDMTYAITYNGAATNTLSADGASSGDTNEGYTATDEGSEDYNLRSDATLRRTPITVPTS